MLILQESIRERVIIPKIISSKTPPTGRALIGRPATTTKLLITKIGQEVQNIDRALQESCRTGVSSEVSISHYPVFESGRSTSTNQDLWASQELTSKEVGC